MVLYLFSKVRPKEENGFIYTRKFYFNKEGCLGAPGLEFAWVCCLHKFALTEQAKVLTKVAFVARGIKK